MVRTCVNMVRTCVNMVHTCVNMVRTCVNWCAHVCVHMCTHVVWVGLCLNNPDHAKTWRKKQKQSLRRSYSAKFSLTSYSPSSLFWAFRSIWGFWKWSQMIPHTQKPGVYKKKQVSSLLRNGVTPWRAPPPPETVDDDFRHLNDVDVLLLHVDWVRLYPSYPDQKTPGL